MRLYSDMDNSSANIETIKRIIPHRYPFLLIDKVIDIASRKKARGIKNVTINEPHFQGHFPEQPVMPGIMIVEAMAQTAAIMVGFSSEVANENFLVYFLAIDKCKFRRELNSTNFLAITTAKLKCYCVFLEWFSI